MLLWSWPHLGSSTCWKHSNTNMANLFLFCFNLSRFFKIFVHFRKLTYNRPPQTKVFGETYNTQNRQGFLQYWGFLQTLLIIYLIFYPAFFPRGKHAVVLEKMSMSFNPQGFCNHILTPMFCHRQSHVSSSSRAAKHPSASQYPSSTCPLTCSSPLFYKWWQHWCAFLFTACVSCAVHGLLLDFMGKSCIEM